MEFLCSAEPFNEGHVDAVDAAHAAELYVKQELRYQKVSDIRDGYVVKVWQAWDDEKDYLGRFGVDVEFSIKASVRQ